MKDYELEIIKSHLELLASQIESSTMTDSGEVCRKIRFISGCIVSAGKPRTKTEFAECEFEKLSDLVLAFESGDELYYEENTTGYKYELDMYGAISMHKHSEKLYRKVETEIDERQEFIEKSEQVLSENTQTDHDIKEACGALYDAGCRFKLVEK